MREKTKVWILAAPGAGLMNLCGSWEVFSHANDVLGRAAYEFGVFGPFGPHIVTGHGLMIGEVRPLPRSVKNPPNIVIVGGGSAAKPSSEFDLKIARWLRKHSSGIETVASICAGAFTLAESGLLDGRRATTHWLSLDHLRRRFPKVRVVDEGIYMRDGKYWTSAGITAGIDMCLALVERDQGHAVAMQVAQRLLLFLHRSGDQAQFSAALERQTNAPDRLTKLSAYVAEHIDSDLRVPELARALGMSVRTLTRWCKTELGESPAEAVRRLRLEEAKRTLASTDLPLKTVAARTGLGDPSTLFRAFLAEYGVTPDQYRERFSSALQ